MMKLFRYNWLLLMLATCLLAVSCKEDDSSIPEIKPNDPVNTEDVKKVLNSATTEWGISRDAVIKHMDGYKTVSGTDKDMLQFKPEKGGQSIAYRFADDKLIATAVLLPTTSAELDLQSMLNGYAYFAKLSDGEVYENRTANTLATVWNPTEANSSYSAIGFAPVKYANYGMSSSITVNTGEVSDIATKSVTLSGNLTGVTTSVEVGFFYGTENTLTEQSDKKSTTSSSNFSVTLTELSSNTTYYYRAYAIVDDMYYYGEVKTFTTKDYNKSFTYNGATYNMILVEGCSTGDFYIMDKEIPGTAFDYNGDGVVSYNECNSEISSLRVLCGGMPLRIPCVNEWQYAARGGSKSKGYKYSGSDDVNDVAWYSGNSTHEPHAFGLKKPNELGIYDMSGNWAEICHTEDYDGDDYLDTQYYKYVCGGSCDNVASACQATSKKTAITTGKWRNCFHIYDSTQDFGHIGIRLVYTKGH
jgi:hypothetical protein